LEAAIAQREVTVAVVGGGCAGLAVANRLVELGIDSIAIIEPREQYERDRTWCFWTDASAADPAAALPKVVREAIRWRWPSWRVGLDGQAIERARPGLTYAGLAGDDYYDAILPTLDGVQWFRGWRADEVEASRVVAEREGNRIELRARHVIDTRPPSAYRANDDQSVGGVMTDEESLVQQFAGATYRGDFDDDVATLMQFDAESIDAYGLSFMYVLPMGDGEAIIDWTGMLRRPVPAAEAVERLDRMVARHLPNAHRVLGGYCESGLLPMGPASDERPADDGVIRIGAGGGACRPSTGYAFLQIHRQAASVAQDIAAGRRDVARRVPRRPAVVRYLDGVFVRKLRREPELFPKLFTNLFAKSRPDRLARFLADVPRLADVATVVMAMPKVPFAREAVRGSRIARWFGNIDWNRHRQLAVPATVMATLLVAIVFGTIGMPLSWQVGLVALAATVGMAHGATDVWLGRRMFGDDAAGRLRFGGGYLVATLAALSLYAVSPGIWLFGFLLLGVLHFGFGELPGLVPRHAGEGAASLVRGLMPITLPAMLYNGDITFALSALAPSVATTAAAVLSAIAPVTLLAAVGLALLSLQRRDGWAAAELLAVTAMLVIAPPLIGFALYFAIWHSSRHLLSDVIDAPAGGEERPWSPVVGATVLPIVAAFLIYLAVQIVPVAPPAATSTALRVTFVTLGCLTVPHMALVLLAARRHAVPSSQPRFFHSPETA
jgi:lycopene beta-cyclase